MADVLHSTWWEVQILEQRGVDVVMSNDGRRKVDFTEGRVQTVDLGLCLSPAPVPESRDKHSSEHIAKKHFSLRIT